MSAVRRIRYAHVVAGLAAFIALATGTAAALDGKNTVDSGDIIDQEVKSADLRNEGARAADIRDEDLTGEDLEAGSIKGSDIEESSLGKVPGASHALTADHADGVDDAQSATTAVDADTLDGLHLRTFGQSGGNFSFIVVDLGGLRLRANCSGTFPNTHNFELVATTTTSNAYIRSSSGADDLDFDSGDSLEVQNSGNGANSVVYRAPGNHVVSAELTFDETNSGCSFSGTALGN